MRFIVGGGVNRSPCKDAEGKTIYWRIGELEWEAWMRVLDNAVRKFPKISQFNLNFYFIKN